MESIGLVTFSLFTRTSECHGSLSFPVYRDSLLLGSTEFVFYFCADLVISVHLFILII